MYTSLSTLLLWLTSPSIPLLLLSQSNTDKGPHAITTTRTPQQIFSTRAYLDLLPSVNRAVLESSLSKYLAGDASKAQVYIRLFYLWFINSLQYQHCLDMYNIFKSVASDVGLHKSMLKENRTLSSRDIRRRENLQRAIKVFIWFNFKMYTELIFFFFCSSALFSSRRLET